MKKRYSMNLSKIRFQHKAPIEMSETKIPQSVTGNDIVFTTSAINSSLTFITHKSTEDSSKGCLLHFIRLRLHQIPPVEKRSVCFLQHPLNVGFLVDDLSADEIVRQRSGRTVILQRATTNMQPLRQLYVREKLFAAENAICSCLFQLSVECFLRLFHTFEQIRDARFLLSYEIVLHNVVVFV